MMNSNLTEILEDRQKTHGDFADHARATQALKSVITAEVYYRSQRGQPPLTAEQLEALEMIAHKIGRILAGDPNFEDHWTDIAGYAQIAKQPEEEVKREEIL
jgi:hypothetical protein